jgi:hypothetical protein
LGRESREGLACHAGIPRAPVSSFDAETLREYQTARKEDG